jgi:hypothetical protein
VSRDNSGALVLGSAPPLSYVETTDLPSFHRTRDTAVRDEPQNGS